MTGAEAGSIAQVLAGDKELKFSIALDDTTLLKLALVLLIVFGISWLIVKLTK